MVVTNIGVNKERVLPYVATTSEAARPALDARIVDDYLSTTNANLCRFIHAATVTVAPKNAVSDRWAAEEGVVHPATAPTGGVVA